MGSIADEGSDRGNPFRRFGDHQSSDVCSSSGMQSNMNDMCKSPIPSCEEQFPNAPFVIKTDIPAWRHAIVTLLLAFDKEILPAEFYTAVSVVLDMFVKHAQQQHYSASPVPSAEKCIKSISILKTLLCPSVAQNVGTQTDYVLSDLRQQLTDPAMKKNTDEVQPTSIELERFNSNKPLSDKHESSSSSDRTSDLSIRSSSSQSLASSDLRDEDSDFEFSCADCGDKISLFNGDLPLSWDRHCQKPCHLLAVKPEEKGNPILVQQQCRELAKDSNSTNKVATKEKTLEWVQSEIVKMKEEVNIKFTGNQFKCVLCRVLATSPLSLLEHLKGKSHKKNKITKVEDKGASNKIDIIPQHREKPCHVLAVKSEKKDHPTALNPLSRNPVKESNPTNQVATTEKTLQWVQSEIVKMREEVNVKFTGNQFNCVLCGVLLTSSFNMLEHLKSKSHKKKKITKVGDKGASNKIDIIPQHCEKPCHVLAVKPEKKEHPTALNLQSRNPVNESSPTNQVATAEKNLQCVQSEIVNIKFTGNQFNCVLCGVLATSPLSLLDHLKGKSHKKKKITKEAGKGASNKIDTIPHHCEKPHHVLDAVKPEKKEHPTALNPHSSNMVKGSNPTNQAATKEKNLKWVHSVIAMMREEVNVQFSKNKIKCVLCGIVAPFPFGILDHLNGKLHQKKKLTKV